MPWSTSQIAELAGTTVKAVRHYHEIGLLDEPERRSNGYKQYEIAHLVRLLRITRLRDLGVPLAEIGAMTSADEHPGAALQVLDAELEATIARLQTVRAELAVIMQHGSPADLPPGFGVVGRDLSAADRSLMLIYSRVFDEGTMQDLRQMIETSERSPEDTEFETLPEDADEAVRQDLAERYVPQIERVAREQTWIDDATTRVPKRGAKDAMTLVGEALVDLYNPAQLDVMRRVHEIRTRNGTMPQRETGAAAAADAAEERTDA